MACPPKENHYLYTQVTLDLWKRKKAADGWDVPEGHVLWLVKHHFDIWVAVTSETCTTNTEVLHENCLVFSSLDADVRIAGPHKWDMWDKNKNCWEG